MSRMFATTLARLCLATGAMVLFVAAGSKASVGDERPTVQLGQDWTSFPPADRASCLQSTGSTGAYTDLLKCLEIKRNARQLAKQPGTAGRGGSP